MGGRLEGERWVTRDSSARGSSVCADFRRMRRDIGFRRLSLDLDFWGGGGGATVGIDVPLELPVSLSLMPLSNEGWDLENME